MSNKQLIAEARAYLADKQPEITSDGLFTYTPFYVDLVNDLCSALEDAEKQIPRWIPTSERLPENDGVYVVIVKSKSYRDGKWEYDTDIASSHGSYIDDFWDTQCDWCEGQEVHVAYWMPMPEEWREAYENV